jgi:hypothetical protein
MVSFVGGVRFNRQSALDLLRLQHRMIAQFDLMLSLEISEQGWGFFLLGDSGQNSCWRELWKYLRRYIRMRKYILSLELQNMLVQYKNQQNL